VSTKDMFVFQKDAIGDSAIQFDISDKLLLSETITDITLGPVSPISPTELFISLTSGSLPQVAATLSGGDNNVSYGVQLVVTTNARVFTCLIAVSVMTDVQVPYTTSNPMAYEDMVDTVEAGNAAIGTAIFQFPASFDPRGGFVNWELLTGDGTVYASGNAFDYQIQSSGISNNVIARSVINVPSSVPPSQFDQKYKIRYTLDLSNKGTPSLDNQQYIYYSFEDVTVIGLTTVPLGVMPAVELQGNPATLEIVVDKLYDNMVVEIQCDNKTITGQRVSNFQRVASGYFYTASAATNALPVSLEPYAVLWSYGNNSNAAQVFTESTELWVVNSSILSAVADVKRKITKAMTTLYGHADLIYTTEEVIAWLRRGRDAFNGASGNFTSFTMTNAKGAIREYWLLYAEVAALEAQYIAEGEKAFNFSGAAISLDVDRTGMLDAAASKIQSRLDNEIKPFKQNLIIKGNTSGDGSADISRLRHGAIGSVGITVTAASIWGGSGPGIWTRYN